MEVSTIPISEIGVIRRCQQGSWQSKALVLAGYKADSQCPTVTEPYRLLLDVGPHVSSMRSQVVQYAPRQRNTAAGVCQRIRRSHSSDQDAT